MTDHYDVIVIGAGPGGYVAAIRCAQLGLNTACIDRWLDNNQKASLGGTCLNVGCIPSKALLDSSEQYHKLNHQFATHGIRASDVSIDVPTMLARKDKIVSALTSGISVLFKANGVTNIHGHAKLIGDMQVEVSNSADEMAQQTLSAKNIIIASGSEPMPLNSATFDNEFIVDSAGALEFSHVPKRLGIIGAGVIGLELGSVWRRLGSEVTVLEALDSFLPAADHQVAREAQRQFKKQGLDIRLNSFVQSANVAPSGIDVHYKQADGSETVQVDRLIVAIGRRPFTDDLLGEGCGVDLDERGFIRVDERLQTTASNVYAIGDAVPGPMLAHKASEDGIAVAETIAGGHGHINYATVPWVIYTSPEIAWVGETEQDLKSKGVATNTGSFPFAATGRARAMEEPVGFVKMIADAETDHLLGVHIIGPHASELIAEAVLAMEYHASAEDLARTIHAHPTLSEAMHEAALAVDKRAIHKAN